MINQAKPLILQSLEECHAGSGSSIGLVDLPIQREQNTQFPKFESSTLKGCIREHFEDMQASVDDAINIQHLFGYEQSSSKNAEEKFNSKEDKEKLGKIEKDFAGALSITDARILLFPVRSFFGVWAYITCPLVLKKFFQQLKTYCLIDCNIDLTIIDKLIDKVSAKSVIVSNDKTYLEEYMFQFVKDDSIDILVEELQELTGIENIGERLAVVDDDIFTMFTRHHTVVHTRNKIGDDGVAVGGALFTEEMLNSETVMYSFVMPNNTFAKQNFKDNDPLAYFTEKMQKNAVFQLGAGFTSGKGILRATNYSKPKEDSNGK
jgi:CRISPR-associated protein Cmr4